MISSLIVRLQREADNRATIQEIASHPALETGDLIDCRLLPVTIDAVDRHQSEEVTRWLQSLPGVEFVDVVFVSFDDLKSIMVRRETENALPCSLSDKLKTPQPPVFGGQP